MRIGIDFRMAGVQNGGLGRYVLELTKAILKSDSTNEYFLFCREPEAAGPFTSLPNVRLIKADFRHYSFSEQIFFPRLLNRFALDLVHFPNFNVPIAYKRPFVVTIHDLIHHKIGGVKKTNLLHFWAYKEVISRAARAAKAVITVSQQSKKDIQKELSIPAEKISVIYEGVSLLSNVADKEISRAKARYFLDKPYFIFVGVLQRNKNLPALVEGFALFQQKYGQPFHLVIAGKSDPHYPEIKARCLLSPSANDLVFTGSISDDDLKALYAGARAFVSASVLEGFGLPGLEAAAFGVPLAVSNLPVFNEIYEDAAIYFDPGSVEEISQCLKLLAFDEKFHGQVSRSALKRASFFSWEKCAKETLEVYKSLKY